MLCMSFMGYRGDSQNPDESMEPESTLLWICESIWNQLDGIGKGKSGQRDKPCTKPNVTKLKEPAYQQCGCFRNKIWGSQIGRRFRGFCDQSEHFQNVQLVTQQCKGFVC